MLRIPGLSRKSSKQAWNLQNCKACHELVVFECHEHKFWLMANHIAAQFEKGKYNATEVFSKKPRHNWPGPFETLQQAELALVFMRLVLA